VISYASVRLPLVSILFKSYFLDVLNVFVLLLNLLVKPETYVNS